MCPSARAGPGLACTPCTLARRAALGPLGLSVQPTSTAMSRFSSLSRHQHAIHCRWLVLTGGGQEEVDNVYLMLDNQLRPLEPDASCQQSMQIFREHKQLAQEYLKVQTQMAYLSRHKEDLMEKLSEAEGLSQLDQQDTEQQQELLRKLTEEKENLLQLHQNLRRQLDLIQRKQTSSQEDGWVVIPHQDQGV